VERESNPYASPAVAYSGVEGTESAAHSRPWQPRVAGGLGTIWVGSLVALAAKIVQFTLRTWLPTAAIRYLSLAEAVALGLGAVVTVIGVARCRAATPKEAAASISINVSLLATLAYAAAQGLVVSLYFRASSTTFQRWTLFAAWILSVVSLLIVGFYCERMARHLAKPGLEWWARLACGVASVWVVCQILYTIYAGSNAQLSKEGIGIVRLIGVTWWFVVLIAFLALIASLRRALFGNGAQSDASMSTRAEVNPPGANWLKDRPASSTWAAVGLALIGAGVIVLVLAIATPFILAISPELASWRPGIYSASRVMIVIARAIELAGAVCCWAAAKAAATRGIVQIASGALFVALCLKIAQLPVAAEVVPRAPGWIELVPVLPEFVWGIMFLVGLQRLLVFVGRQDLARRARLLLILSIAWLPIELSYLSARFLIANAPSTVLYAMMTAWTVAFYGDLVLVTLYFGLLQRTREAILKSGPG
jgi:hypothetical protein